MSAALTHHVLIVVEDIGIFLGLMTLGILGCCLMSWLLGDSYGGKVPDIKPPKR